MAKCTLQWLIPVATLLEFVVHTQPTNFDNSNNFISNNHVRYVVDDIAAIQSDMLADVQVSNFNALNLKRLKFEPAYLDFKQRPLGVPHMEKVVLFNTDKNQSIDMTSISGNTVYFHCSFFEDKKIPPMGNTTFNVVFLGREEGHIESSLYIHTNEGQFRYQVKGASVFSPYRLRPIVGVKIPPNVDFSPAIYLHNPHSRPIQIVEVYSSGGDFHLELPGGEFEGTRNMWEVAPFDTKAVIRLRFHSRVEQKHTAYIRLKLNRTEDALVIPLEVHVTNDAGLYAPNGPLDFGVGGSYDLPKRIPLIIQNPTKKYIKIHAITTTSKAIGIEMLNWKLDGVSNKPVMVANITLNWKTAYDTNDFSGKIRLTYKNGKSFSDIPYYLTVVQGGLHYNTSMMQFCVKDNFNPRKITVRNDFHTPITLLNATLSADMTDCFALTDFKRKTLKSNAEGHIFTISFKTNSKNNCHRSGHVTLHTNISIIEMPLVSYDGKLKLYLPYKKNKEGALDLGLMGFDSTKSFNILLVNENPEPIQIKSLNNNLYTTNFHVLGCAERYQPSLLLQASFDQIKSCVLWKIRPQEAAVLSLEVKTKRSEGHIRGEISVVTQFEEIKVPVKFAAAPGKLEIGPDRLVFDQCFPGKICSHPIKVHSTFNEPMVIEDITSIPHDIRVSANHTKHITSKATKVVGHLFLDPRATCQDECYLGFSSTELANWFITLRLYKSTPDFDLNLLNIFYNRYLNLTHNAQKRWQNLTMRLDTTQVRGHNFNTRVMMSWPSLVREDNDDHIKIPSGNCDDNRTVMTWPLTQVGATIFQNITIRNPSSSPLLVQLVLDQFYPGHDVLYEGLPPAFIPMETGHELEAEVLHGVTSPPSPLSRPLSSFFFHPQHDLDDFAGQFKRYLNVPIQVHPSSLPIILAPNATFIVSLGYRASEATESTALLFVRNNLTVLEVVQLRGQGAHANFKFGNRKPGSTQPLAFELTEKHLKDCERDKAKRHPLPNLTVKRSFTARNNGDFDIAVMSFFINDLQCEGYGFRVLNCEPFHLAPNATRKINIAFTPDFTLARVTRSLILVTNLHVPVNYTLVTTVPYNYLALCSEVIARPLWETYMYYAVALLMVAMLIILALLAVIESERVMTHTLNTMITKHQSTIAQNHPENTLDLRMVGALIRAEMKYVANLKAENAKFKDCMNRMTSQDDPPTPAAPAAVNVSSAGDGIYKKSQAENVVKLTSVAPVANGLASNSKPISNEPREQPQVHSESSQSVESDKYSAVLPIFGKAKKKFVARKTVASEHQCTAATSAPVIEAVKKNHQSSCHQAVQNYKTPTPSPEPVTQITPEAPALVVTDAPMSPIAYLPRKQPSNKPDISTTLRHRHVNIKKSEVPLKAATIDTHFMLHHPPNEISTLDNEDTLSCSATESSRSTGSSCSTKDTDDIAKSAMCPSSGQRVKKGIKSPSDAAKSISSFERARVERRKSTPKSMKIKESKDRENHDKGVGNEYSGHRNKHNGNNYHSGGGHNKSKERREKQLLAKKLSLDKNAKLNEHIVTTALANQAARNAAFPITNKWDENRASFSDVVARSDVAVASTSHLPTQFSNCSTFSRPLQQLPSSLGQSNSTYKPASPKAPIHHVNVSKENATWYRRVDSSAPGASMSPIKPPNVAASSLGPIGSKKQQDTMWGCSDRGSGGPESTTQVIHPVNGDHGHDASAGTSLSADSFLTLANRIAFESSNAFLDFGATVDGWQTVDNRQSVNSSPNQIDMWNQPTSNGSQNYWEKVSSSLYSHLSTLDMQMSATPPENPPPTPVSHIVGDTASSSPTNTANMVSPPSGYLWGGSNSVWQPWTPPRTPTRTPPGFTPLDEDDTTPHLYNPFGSNIWNQQQQHNPWNYPPQGPQ